MFQWPSGLEWLRDIPILSRQRFVEEQVILSGSDELPRTIHVVLEGVVRLSLLAVDGRERAMLYLGRGMIFGEQAALAQTPLRAGLVAIADKPCLIGHILPKSILAAVKRNPELILDVMRITSEKTSSFLEDLSRSAFRVGPSSDRHPFEHSRRRARTRFGQSGPIGPYNGPYPHHHFNSASSARVAGGDPTRAHENTRRESGTASQDFNGRNLIAQKHEKALFFIYWEKSVLAQFLSRPRKKKTSSINFTDPRFPSL